MGVYKKDKAGTKWRVVIYLGEGKRADWIVEGSRSDAVAFEARKRVELEVGVSNDQRTAPMLSTYCADHYRPFAEPRLKARTWTNRVYTIGTLSKYLGDLRLTDLKKPVLEKYQNDRLGQKIRPSTINDEMKVLRAICSHARSSGVPCVELTVDDLPVRGKRKVTAWTDEQVAALLASVREKSPHIYGLVLFLLNTGCRKGEALALEWPAIDLRRRLIRIEPNEEWQPKNNEAREIPISDRLLLYFNAMSKAKRWVFPADTGDRYAFWPQLAFDRARKAAGLKGGPHTTRHTYATHFLRKCPDLYLLAKVLGHSDITVTKLYSHLLPDHLNRARNAVDFGLIDLV
jgi:integrase